MMLALVGLTRDARRDSDLPSILGLGVTLLSGVSHFKYSQRARFPRDDV